MIKRIEKIDDLKNYFFNSKDRLNDNVYVTTKIRNQWLLNKESTIQQGKIYDIKFTNKGAGVWKAQLKSMTNKV